MDFITRTYLNVREAFNQKVRGSAGQTMAEYALIMAGIAVIAGAAYVTLGGAIVTKVDAIAASL